jgi:hypothetical protein
MGHRDGLAALAERARFAYEVGRLRRAIVRAWPIPLAALLAVRLGSTAAHVFALAVPLSVAAILLVWKGGVAGRAVAPGLAAGTAPLVLPGFAMDCAVACMASCQTWSTVSCVGAGVLAGAFVGYRAARVGDGGAAFTAVAAAIAATTGAMGCLVGGAVGVMGMLAGLAIGAIPVLALVPRSPQV